MKANQIQIVLEICVQRPYTCMPITSILCHALLKLYTSVKIA